MAPLATHAATAPVHAHTDIAAAAVQRRFARLAVTTTSKKRTAESATTVHAETGSCGGGSILGEPNVPPSSTMARKIGAGVTLNHRLRPTGCPRNGPR